MGVSYKQKNPQEEAIWARGVSYRELHRNCPTNKKARILGNNRVTQSEEYKIIFTIILPVRRT